MGDPKFLNRHAGVSGGAISQDQAYFLNKNLVAIKRPTDLLDNPLVLSTVLASLQNPDNNVRAAGLDTLRKVKGVEQRPEFRAAMEQLQTDNNPRLKLIAVSVLQGKKLSEALEGCAARLGARLQLLRGQDRTHSGDARRGRQGLRLLPCQPCDLQVAPAQ